MTQEESLPNLLSAGMWASESSLGKDTICPLHSRSHRHHMVLRPRLHLLQRISETFALGNDKLVALHGGPVSDTGRHDAAKHKLLMLEKRRSLRASVLICYSAILGGRKYMVSVDPFEDQFHGYGLPAFTSLLHQAMICASII